MLKVCFNANDVSSDHHLIKKALLWITPFCERKTHVETNGEEHVHQQVCVMAFLLRLMENVPLKEEYMDDWKTVLHLINNTLNIAHDDIFNTYRRRELHAAYSSWMMPENEDYGDELENELEVVLDSEMFTRYQEACQAVAQLPQSWGKDTYHQVDSDTTRFQYWSTKGIAHLLYASFKCQPLHPMLETPERTLSAVTPYIILLLDNGRHEASPPAALYLLDKLLSCLFPGEMETKERTYTLNKQYSSFEEYVSGTPRNKRLIQNIIHAKRRQHV